jgi:hypothetical protein
MIFTFLKFILNKTLNRYGPDDTFETHECILCKDDVDASYCIPKPVILEIKSEHVMPPERNNFNDCK